MIGFGYYTPLIPQLTPYFRNKLNQSVQTKSHHVQSFTGPTSSVYHSVLRMAVYNGCAALKLNTPFAYLYTKKKKPKKQLQDQVHTYLQVSNSSFNNK